MRTSFTERNAIILYEPTVQQAEQDCACADTGFAPYTEQPTEGVAVWQIAVGLYRAPLPDAHELAFNPLGSVGVIVLNEQARAILDTFVRPRPLDGATSRQLAVLGLLQPQGITPALIHSQPHTLAVWLHVTNACNLRCAYCYLVKTDEAMDEPTGRAVIDAVFRSAVRHRFRAVKLKYAGGEPTLYFDLVTQFQAYARAQADELGLELVAVVLSNGVALSEQMLKTMLAQEIHLSISLDGLDGDHDAQCPRADGSGSASAVRDTIEQALLLGLCPDVTVTVTDRNLDTLPNVVAWLVEHDLPFNLNFYRENDNSASHTDLRLQAERLIAALRKAFVAIEEYLPQRSLFSSLLDRVQFVASHHYPCTAGRNYLVIDPSGRISQCQMTMHQPITDVWADDPLVLVQATLWGIRAISVDKKEGCQSCQWRYWCAGGCPLQTYRATGRYNVRSPLCEVYRTLLPDVIRLEGLRLLRHEHTDI
ncbi:MAG: SPASM domain-containing protein [Chloroflexi bacterium]|nr:SPASM domain-containing protein [Chloroflexota bacterium]